MTADDPRPALRETLARFDERKKKIAGGVLAVMIDAPDRVRDQEWISEQLAQITLLSTDVDGLESPQAGVEEVRGYLRANAEEILLACYGLFQVTAEDLAPRVPDGLGRDEALAHAMTYFVPPEEEEE